MRRLSRVARREAKSGTPLPQPVKALRDIEFIQLRGQLSLIVASPGRGKSLLALNMSILLAAAGVRVLYVSSDTDAHDQIIRAATMTTGRKVPDELRSDVPWLVETLSGLPELLSFEFDSNPTAEDLKDMVEAYRLVYGDYPWLIVVDTIGRIWSENTDDESIMAREAVQRLDEIARHTGAHVMALHHAVKMYDDGSTPIPLSGIIHGVAKIPPMALTMFGDDQGRLALCPVKHRSGPMDATAMSIRAWIKIDPQSLRIVDLPGPIVVDIGRDIHRRW